MRTFIMASTLFLFYSTAHAGPFGDFEGEYEAYTSESNYEAETYRSIHFKSDGKVLFKTYNKGNLLYTCKGRGKFLSNQEVKNIQTNLMNCGRSGRKIRLRLKIGIPFFHGVPSNKDFFSNFLYIYNARGEELSTSKHTFERVD